MLAVCLFKKWHDRVGHLAIFPKPRHRNLDNLRPAPDGRRIFPFPRAINSVEPQTRACTNKIQAHRRVRFEQNVGGLRIKFRSAHALNPAILDVEHAVDRVALAEKDVILFIHGKSSRVVEPLEHSRVDIARHQILEFVKSERLAVCTIIAVEKAAKFGQFS